MIIDQNLLNSLTEQAKASPRLRQNFDLRNTPEDNSQRMLNAIESGSNCVESVELTPAGPVFALTVPMGQWHTVRALESGTVILETKDGRYEPLGPEDVMGGGYELCEY